MKLGIDLHNVRDGGGVNYISNLLREFDPARHGFIEIHVWGSCKVLSQIPCRSGVIKHTHPFLEKVLPWRLWFMIFYLNRALKENFCDLLYSPGGLYLGSFRPFVTISRNMMPYDSKQWKLYPKFSFDRGRLSLLRKMHSITFCRANGMIYLTEMAKQVVNKISGRVEHGTIIIPHGVNHDRFNRLKRKSINANLDVTGEIRLVYPSRLEPYKHQIEVIEAVASLREEFPGLILELCGPANISYKKRVMSAIEINDPHSCFIRYLGELQNRDLPDLYERSHLLIFASSCENLPNTLIEAIAFGIPTLCSHQQPMPEVAGDACLYFDPTSSESIKNCIRIALQDWSGCLDRVVLGMKRSAYYSWDKCADNTFLFLRNYCRNTA